MNARRTDAIIVGVGVTLIAAAIALAGCKREGAVAQSDDGDEFVCYEDGELSERHVGVAYTGIRNTMHVIRYTDGQTMHYQSKPGETCGMEAAP